MTSEDFKKDLLESLCRDLTEKSKKVISRNWISGTDIEKFKKRVLSLNHNNVIKIKKLKVGMEIDNNKVYFTFCSEKYNFNYKIEYKR